MSVVRLKDFPHALQNCLFIALSIVIICFILSTRSLRLICSYISVRKDGETWVKKEMELDEKVSEMRSKSKVTQPRTLVNSRS